MLEWIRENKRWAQIVLIALIFPFACTGIEGYRRMQGDTDSVAKIAGQKISRQEYDAAVAEQMDRLKQMLGGNVDPKMFDTPQARQAIMDQLITQRVFAAQARRERMSMSDAQLREMIAAVPAFQDGGKFSQAKYEQYLMSQGLTGAQFDSRVRQDVAMQQLARFPAESAIVPQVTVANMIAAYQQERIVSVATFGPADYLGKANATDDAVKAYYEANKSSFETPEHADIEYLVLSVDVIAESIKVSADDVAQYYQQNQARYRMAEQRRASHILVAVAPGASDAEKKAARAKVESILAQVRKTPGDFGKLAKQYSDDPGSKDRGGDLDYFVKGAMVKPFDDAVFSMKQGEISGLVQSDFGFHIIQLTGVRSGIKTIDEVRSEIEADIRKQVASRKLSEQAETFTNTVYEQSDSLKPAADKLGLTIRTASDFSRESASSAKYPSLGNPKFLAAIFGDDAIRNKRNTPAIEISPGAFVSGRVTAYHPRATRSLEEVKPLIVEAVKREEALKLAQAAGAAELLAQRENKGSAKFASPIKVSRQNQAGLQPDALRAVLRAGTGKLPQFVGADIGPQGYAIYRIDAIGQPAADDVAAGQRKSLEQSLAKTGADAEADAMAASVRSHMQVEILQANLDKELSK